MGWTKSNVQQASKLAKKGKAWEKSDMRTLYANPQLELLPRECYCLETTAVVINRAWQGRSSTNCAFRSELIQGILISLRASQDWSGQSKPQNCFFNKTGQSLFKKKQNKTKSDYRRFCFLTAWLYFLVCGSLIHLSQRGWHYRVFHTALELSCLWVLGSSRVEKAKLIWVQILVHPPASHETLASYLTFSSLSSATEKLG